MSLPPVELFLRNCISFVNSNTNRQFFFFFFFLRINQSGRIPEYRILLRIIVATLEIKKLRNNIAS